MRTLSSTGLLIWLELGFAVVMGTAFIVLYALRSAWRSSPMGKHMMAFAIATTLADATLFMALGWRIPYWIYPVVFLSVDVVFLQRLWLLVKAQNKEDRDEVVRKRSRLVHEPFRGPGDVRSDVPNPADLGPTGDA